MRGIIAIDYGTGRLKRVIEVASMIAVRWHGAIIVADQSVSEALSSEFDVWTVIANSTTIRSLPDHRRHKTVGMYTGRDFTEEISRQAAGIFRRPEYTPPLSKGYIHIVHAIAGNYGVAENICSALATKGLHAINNSDCRPDSARVRTLTA